jgi:hypothetical protein
MLWFVFIIFLALWILGLIGTIAVGAWAWFFLAICLIALIAQLTTGRRNAPALRQ